MYEEEKKSGHKYNVEKQKTIYRSEVERIWKAQSDSLSNPVPPEMDEEDAYSAAAPTPSAAHVRGHSRAQSVRHDATPAAQTPGDDESQADVDTRVLKIRRFIKNKWVSEVVRDPGVTHAYVRQRQRIEDETTASEALVPTDDAAINAARRKRLQDEIAAAKKNQERRLQRKKAKAAAEGLEIEGGYKALVNKTDTKVRAPACGYVLSADLICSASLRSLRRHRPHGHEHVVPHVGGAASLDDGLVGLQSADGAAACRRRRWRPPAVAHADGQRHVWCAARHAALWRAARLLRRSCYTWRAWHAGQRRQPARCFAFHAHCRCAEAQAQAGQALCRLVCRCCSSLPSSASLLDVTFTSIALHSVF